MIGGAAEAERGARTATAAEMIGQGTVTATGDTVRIREGTTPATRGGMTGTAIGGIVEMNMIEGDNPKFLCCLMYFFPSTYYI